jgi:voltage-gated potassium channel Kch
MALTPLLLMINDRVVQPRLTKRKAVREPDEITEHDNPVILAGFGRFGHVIGRLIRANGFGVTVLDSDPDQVAMLGRFGMKSYYGDATRLDLLRAAGGERAKLFVLAIDDEVHSLDIVKMVQREFPQMRILARAISRQHAYELLRLGVPDVYRETLSSAIDLGAEALRALGLPPAQAGRAARIFKKYDEAAVRDMAQLSEEDEEYVSRGRQHIENLERVLQADRAGLRDALTDSPESDGASPDASVS